MPIEGRTRQPRAWLNGITLLKCTVYQTRQSSASEFTADMALDDPSNPGPSFWSCSSSIEASITATNGDGTGEGTLINGKIDHVNIDWDLRIVSVHGRDRTADMLDARMQEGLPNKTYAEILGEIAGKHGLSLHLDGGGDMAGKTFNFQEYQFQADVENEWDVVQHIAQLLGKQAHVFGNNLYVTTPGSTDSGTYVIQYTPPTPQSYAVGNFITLKTSVDLSIAEGGNSTASTHHTNAKESFTSDQGY